jgi:hypothetical protein
VRDSKASEGEEVRLFMPIDAVVYDVIVEAMRRLDFAKDVKEGQIAVADVDGRVFSNQALLSSLSLRPNEVLFIHRKKELNIN